MEQQRSGDHSARDRQYAETSGHAEDCSDFPSSFRRFDSPRLTIRLSGPHEQDSPQDQVDRENQRKYRIRHRTPHPGAGRARQPVGPDRQQEPESPEKHRQNDPPDQLPPQPDREPFLHSFPPLTLKNLLFRSSRKTGLQPLTDCRPCIRGSPPDYGSRRFHVHSAMKPSISNASASSASVGPYSRNSMYFGCSIVVFSSWLISSITCFMPSASAAWK